MRKNPGGIPARLQELYERDPNAAYTLADLCQLLNVTSRRVMSQQIYLANRRGPERIELVEVYMRPKRMRTCGQATAPGE